MSSTMQSTIQATQQVEEVPIFSRLRNKVQNLEANWPSTSKYETIPANVPAKNMDESVRKAIEMGQKAENQVCCSCVGDCATNPSCECRILAEKMAQKFDGEVMKQGVPFQVKLDQWKSQYWGKPSSVCGPRCSCQKACSLRALEDLDKDHKQKFEIVRKNAKGFCLFTKKAIRKGSPVLPFNGEISTEIEPHSEEEEYSLQMMGKDEEHDKADCLSQILEFLPNLSESYKAELEKAYDVTAHINPLKKGNCARMLSHSCDPNLEIVRVFQNGVSPADLRIVLISTRDIAPNTELCFDYGPKYVKLQFKGHCLCEKCVQRRKEQVLKEKEEKRKQQAAMERKRGIPLSERDDPVSKRTRFQGATQKKWAEKMGIANTAEFVG